MKLEDMTLKKALDIFSEFSLVHQPCMGELDGLCMYYPRIILVEQGMERVRTTETVLHEMYHALHFLKGERQSEKQVREETRRSMKRLYGYEGNK